MNTIVIYCNVQQMGRTKSDHNRRLITLVKITLSGSTVPLMKKGPNGFIWS